jgi:hypothetical protein
MAKEIPILDLSYPADEDLSEDQYHFVVLTSTGTVRRPNNGTEFSLGILQNAPAEGEAAVVRIMGISKLVANDALAIGDFVMPEYVGATDAGKGDVSTGSEAYTRALVVAAAGAEDGLCSVIITPARPPGAYSVGEIAIADGKMIVGKSGVGFAATPSGDLTITSAGVTAIGAHKVVTTMIGTSKVTSAKIASSAVLTTRIGDAAVTVGKLGAASVSVTKLKLITIPVHVASNTNSGAVSSASATGGTILGIYPSTGSTARHVAYVSLVASTIKVKHVAVVARTSHYRVVVARA